MIVLVKINAVYMLYGR